MNSLNPDRYGHLNEPWAQKKHFETHNYSQVPLNSYPAELNRNEYNFNNTSPIPNQNALYMYQTTKNGNVMENNSFALRSKESELDKKFRTKDETKQLEQSLQFYTQKGSLSNQPTQKILPQQKVDSGYEEYKKQQEELMIEKYREFKLKKEQEQQLEINNFLKDQEIFLQQSEKNKQKDQYSLEQERQQQMQQSYLQPGIQQNQLRSIQPKQLPGPGYDVQMQAQQSQSKLNQTQKQLPALEILNYKQRYRLNDHFTNPNFGLSKELFQNYFSNEKIGQKSPSNPLQYQSVQQQQSQLGASQLKKEDVIQSAYVANQEQQNQLFNQSQLQNQQNSIQQSGRNHYDLITNDQKIQFQQQQDQQCKGPQQNDYNSLNNSLHNQPFDQYLTLQEQQKEKQQKDWHNQYLEEKMKLQAGLQDVNKKDQQIELQQQYESQMNDYYQNNNLNDANQNQYLDLLKQQKEKQQQDWYNQYLQEKMMLQRKMTESQMQNQLTQNENGQQQQNQNLNAGKVQAGKLQDQLDYQKQQLLFRQQQQYQQQNDSQKQVQQQQQVIMNDKKQADQQDLKLLKPFRLNPTLMSYNGVPLGKYY